MQPQTVLDGPRSSSPSRERTATERLVNAAKGGDQRAWDQLVARYSGLLWAVTRGYRLGAVEANDVVQTTWLRLIEQLPRLRNPDGVGAWLATTARRESLRTLRAGARYELSDQIEELAGADPRDVGGELLSAERDAGIRAAFDRLPARDQALLRLLTTDPLPSYEEIGAALAMPIGSIGPTRARALERLRLQLRGSDVVAERAAGARP